MILAHSTSALDQLRLRLHFGIPLICVFNSYSSDQVGTIRRITRISNTLCRCTVDDDPDFPREHYLSMPVRARDVAWHNDTDVSWPLNQHDPTMTANFAIYRLPHWTEPGTLDLTQRLPDWPLPRAHVLATRSVCDETGHLPRLYNEATLRTYCHCGFVAYLGDVVPPADPHNHPPIVIPRQRP